MYKYTKGSVKTAFYFMLNWQIIIDKYANLVYNIIVEKPYTDAQTSRR